MPRRRRQPRHPRRDGLRRVGVRPIRRRRAAEVRRVPCRRCRASPSISAVSADLRVLVDVTAVPTDRGGVGRYVDSLLPVLDERDVDLVVVARATDEEHYTKLCPSTRVIAAPTAVASRPVRLAWEQVGLPRVIDAERPDVVHSPALHDAAARTGARSWSRCTTPRSSPIPSVHPAVKAHVLPLLDAGRRCAARRACIVPSAAHPRRAGARDRGRRRADRRRRTTASTADRSTRPTERRASAPSASGSGSASRPLRRVPRHARAAQERARPGPRLRPGRGWRDDPPALVLAGGPGWDDDLDARRWPRCRDAAARVLRPGYLPLRRRCAATSAVPTSWRTRRYGEGFGLPVLEAMACGAAGAHHAAPRRCRRSAATRWPTRRPAPARSRRRCRLLARRPTRRTAARRPGSAAGGRVHLGGGRRCAPRRVPPRRAARARVNRSGRRSRVVVVTYSPGESLADVPRLAGRRPPAAPVEVILADNGSTDGAPERAAERARGAAAPHRRQPRLRRGRQRRPRRGRPTDWVVVANPDIVLAARARSTSCSTRTDRWPRRRPRSARRS